MKSFQPGTMGIAEGSALVFSMAFSRSFLSGPSEYTQKFQEASWLAVLIAGAATMAILFAWVSILRKEEPEDAYTMTEQLVGKKIAKFVAGYYVIAFFLLAASLLRQYAENTLITALPQMDIDVATLWYMLVVCILVYLGIEGIARTAYLLLPYSVVGMLFVILLLAPFYNIYYAFPWQGPGLEKVAPQAVFDGGINLGVMGVLILAPCFQNKQTLKSVIAFGFGGSLLMRMIVNFVFVLVFGVDAGDEKILPFYEMARLVYLNRYIQRIESIFILLWVISGILAVAVSFYTALYLLGRILRLPTIAPLIPLFGIMLVQVSLIPPDIATVIQLDTRAVLFFDVGVYGFPILMILLNLLKRRRKRTCAAD